MSTCVCICICFCTCICTCSCVRAYTHMLYINLYMPMCVFMCCIGIYIFAYCIVYIMRGAYAYMILGVKALSMLLLAVAPQSRNIPIASVFGTCLGVGVRTRAQDHARTHVCARAGVELHVDNSNFREFVCKPIFGIFGVQLHMHLYIHLLVRACTDYACQLGVHACAWVVNVVLRTWEEMCRSLRLKSQSNCVLGSVSGSYQMR